MHYKSCTREQVPPSAIIAPLKETKPKQRKNKMNTVDTVVAQYHRENLTEGILDALKKARCREEAVTIDALAPIDEFHIRGAEATREMIELANFQREHHVLDVGSGIGKIQTTLELR